MTDFKSKQYKKVLEANSRRNEISAKVNTKWTPLDECVHTQLHEAGQHKLILNDIDFTKDSEYMKMFGQQSELIDRWVEQEEKRLPPRPPKSPYE